MIDNEFVKTKLGELDEVKSALQGKTKTSLSDIISFVAALILIAYFVYIDMLKGDKELYVFICMIAAACIYLDIRLHATKKKVDTIIKLLDLEKVAEQKYTDQIKEITNTLQAT